VTTANTGAYAHYVYGPNYVLTYASVNNVAANFYDSDSYSVQHFDGAGRPYAAAGYHPGSVGGFKAQVTYYDVMGRVMKQSNPTEFTAIGRPQATMRRLDFTQQNYDWKGRPLVTTHLADGTQKYATYGGCGCAGGEVVTVTDEVGRQRKGYSDALGRQWKSEILNDGASIPLRLASTMRAIK